MGDELQKTNIENRRPMQAASTETAVAVVKPVSAMPTMPGWLAGVLGITALALAVPGAIAVTLSTGGLAVPPILATIAAICGGISPLVGAGAYWAAGGNPLDLVKTPKPPPGAP